MTTHQIDSWDRPPEAGWEPFLTWCTQQGIDPQNMRSVEWDDETMHATVYEYTKRPGSAESVPRELTISSLPPRKAPNPEADIPLQPGHET
ncbi:MAG: hypothetical protein ACRD0W_06835 [Acidimicrobiales bacterium]